MNAEPAEKQVDSDSPQLQKIDKSKLIGMNATEKESYVEDLFIVYPKVNIVLELLSKCKKSFGISKNPKCGVITGDYRMGKSEVAKRFKMLFPDFQGKEGIIKPVFMTTVPVPAKIGSLISRILYDLGDPFWARRNTAGVDTHRIYELLKDCKVELIIIDEVQHLVDPDSKKLLRESSDWFKELIDKTSDSLRNITF